jgi:hypothetical protein
MATWAPTRSAEQLWMARPINLAAHLTESSWRMPFQCLCRGASRRSDDRAAWADEGPMKVWLMVLVGVLAGAAA